MELRQLEYFVLLAEELNFTRAAERGNVAQPALSRQIRKLEEEFGVPLVDRTTRRTTLTAAGREFLWRARTILEQVGAARSAASEQSQLLSGRLTIGLTQTSGSLDIPGLLAKYHRAHPNVELAVRENISMRLAEQLRADQLDLAFLTAIPIRARDQLGFEPLLTEDLVAAVGADHRLARRRSLKIADLKHEPLIAFPPGATIRSTVDAAATDAGFAAQVAFEITEVRRALALVAEGLGVAVLPKPDVQLAPPDVAAIPIRRPQMRHELFVARRIGRQPSPAASEMLKLVLAE